MTKSELDLLARVFQEAGAGCDPFAQGFSQYQRTTENLMAQGLTQQEAASQMAHMNLSPSSFNASDQVAAKVLYAIAAAYKRAADQSA